MQVLEGLTGWICAGETEDLHDRESGFLIEDLQSDKVAVND